MKKFETDWVDNLSLYSYCRLFTKYYLGNLSGPLLPSWSDSVLLPVNPERSSSESRVWSQKITSNLSSPIAVSWGDNVLLIFRIWKEDINSFIHSVIVEFLLMVGLVLGAEYLLFFFGWQCWCVIKFSNHLCLEEQLGLGIRIKMEHETTYNQMEV